MVKKIFYINSEMEPFASVSNLANLSVDIPLGLQDQGNDVRCLMPKYGFISENIKTKGSYYSTSRQSGQKTTTG